MKWPKLGDDGQDNKKVKEFYEAYESLCGLANDGSGMSAMDHLTTLEQCLEGHKKKIYKMVVQTHRRAQTYTQDPDAVFEEIKDRHMKFAETKLERQMRWKSAWKELTKGNKSAMDFEVEFEMALTELELAGLARSETDLQLDYLLMIGPSLQLSLIHI